ncbi:hypothetical protein [Longimicrobium sp.]|uniref:hypothetical protein n=1 Tax=Longimicrobium sp. TaxID=2029185 RepID=UPI003B3BC6B2
MAKFTGGILPVEILPSENIQESGRNSGGTSSFVCPPECVIVGRWHSGDENGYTRYWYARLLSAALIPYYNDEEVETSPGIQESGKSSGGQSSFICPDNYVIVGRSHDGDENGLTYYKYVALRYNDDVLMTSDPVWSDWMQESGTSSSGYSEFVCPPGTVMTGREHKGDENGDTRYRYSRLWFLQEDGGRVQVDTRVMTEGVSVTESSGQWAIAPENQVMTERRHQGDENGTTTYAFSYCHLVLDADDVTVGPALWTGWMQESGKSSVGYSEFICPPGAVMTGREHQGDENGNTRYQYADVRYNGLLTSTTPGAWSTPERESSGTLQMAPVGEVMVGRKHSGDENGYTEYKYSYIDTPDNTRTAHDECFSAARTARDTPPRYPVGWMPYLADWVRYVRSFYPIYRYHSPEEIDGVGVLMGVYGAKLWGNQLKRQRCEEVRPRDKSEGHYSWVLVPNGDMLYAWNSQLALEERNYTRHSDLNQGEAVTCAGEFYLTYNNFGQLWCQDLYIELNDSSGHYKPNGPKCFRYVIDTLVGLGIATESINVFTRNR